MKTMYYHVVDKKDTLYTLKGAGMNGAVCVVDLSVVRKNHKGHLSMKAAVETRKPFHKGIVKISDTGVSFIE